MTEVAYFTGWLYAVVETQERLEAVTRIGQLDGSAEIVVALGAHAIESQILFKSPEGLRKHVLFVEPRYIVLM